LWKKVCNRYPDSASAPPRISAASARGRRISQMIVHAIPRSLGSRNSCKNSMIGTDTLPEQALQISDRSSSIIRSRNAPAIRTCLPACARFLCPFSCFCLFASGTERIVSPIYLYYTFHPHDCNLYRYVPSSWLPLKIAWISSSIAPTDMDS